MLSLLKQSPQGVIVVDKSSILSATRSQFLLGEIPLPRAICNASSVEIHPQQGWNSLTLLVTLLSGDEYILKIAPESRNQRQAFEKEVWIYSQPALQQVLNQTAPSWGVISGRSQKYNYLLQKRLPGAAAFGYFPQYDTRVMQALGVLAREINNVQVFGYGVTVDPITDQFPFSSWSDFFEREIENSGFRYLIRNGILSKRTQEMLSARFADLKALTPEPTLAHQDFVANWKNVLLVNREVVSGVIDWEYAAGCWGTLYELSSTLYTLYRNAINPIRRSELFSAFLEGYGISFQTYITEFRYLVEADVLRRCVTALWKYESFLSVGLQNQAVTIRLPQAKRAAQLLDAFSSSQEVHLF